MKKIITVFILLISVTIYGQTNKPCDKEKQDLAKIASGNYTGEIEINKYGKDVTKKSATIKIEKVGENKIKISAPGTKPILLDIASSDSKSIDGSITENYQTRSISLVLYDKKATISGGSGNGTYKEGDEFWWYKGVSTDEKPDHIIGENEAFVAQNVSQLDCHLNNIKEDIAGIQYNGTMVRAIPKKYIVNGSDGKPLTIFSGVINAWQRYDVQGQSAIYFAETVEGNKTEISYYGDWDKDYQVWLWDNIVVDNVLDLTDTKNLEILGLTLALLNTGIDSKYEIHASDKTYNYEFTNSISTWARKKGYKGLLVPGARGNKDYKNIVLFTQSDIDNAFNGKEGKILH